MLQTALASLDGLEQNSLVVYRCQQALRQIIHTSWTVAGEYLLEHSSTGSISEQNVPHRNQSDETLGSDDNPSYEASQNYPPFTPADSWIDAELGLDFSWVSALAGNLQVFNGDF